MESTDKTPITIETITGAKSSLAEVRALLGRSAPVTLRGLWFDWNDGDLCEIIGCLPSSPKYYVVKVTSEDEGESIQLFRLSFLLDYRLFSSLSALKRYIGIDEEEEKREIAENLAKAAAREKAQTEASKLPDEHRGFWSRLFSW